MELNIFKKKEKKAKAKRKKPVDKLLKLFKKHIGQENGILPSKIFETYYDENTLSYNDAEIFFMWSKIQSSMNRMRKNTKCFVVKNNGVYFVPTNYQEAKGYINKMTSTARKIDAMVERCKTSIEESWHKRL